MQAFARRAANLAAATPRSGAHILPGGATQQGGLLPARVSPCTDPELFTARSAVRSMNAAFPLPQA